MQMTMLLHGDSQRTKKFSKSVKIIERKFDAVYDASWFDVISSIISGSSRVDVLDSVINIYASSGLPKKFQASKIP